MREVTVVTVTYGDRRRYLVRLLERIDALEGAAAVGAIVVVANGAAPSVRQWLAEAAAADPRLRIVYLDENRGSAAGFGAGIAEAVEVGGDEIWLLDDDNLPAPGALAALLAARTRHPGAALQSRRPGHPSLPAGATAPQPLRWGVYGGFFASRAAFAAAGTPREDFVLYGDDTEYTHRFGELLLVPDSVVTDLEEPWWVGSRRRATRRSAVPGLRGGRERRRMYYTVRNSLFFRRHGAGEGPVRLAAIAALKAAALLPLAAVAALRCGSPEPFRNLAVYVLASWHGLTGRLGPREGWA